MKIAIDESGDSGRKLWLGSSVWFVVAAVIVPDVADGCGPTCQCIARYRAEVMDGRELHFSRNSHDQHLDFFRYMHDKDFVYASVAIDKRQLLRKNPRVMISKMSLLRYALHNLFRELEPWLDSPLVIMDTNGSRHFNRALNRYLINDFGPAHKGDYRAIKEVRAVDSRTEPLVQFADYVAGAIRHHVDKNYPSNSYELYLADKGKIFFC